MEIMVTDAEVERRISAAESTERIADAAKQGGMRTMWDSGVDHVIDRRNRSRRVAASRWKCRPTPGRSARPPRVRHRPQHHGDRRARDAALLSPAVRPTACGISCPRKSSNSLTMSPGRARSGVRQTVLLVEDEDPLRVVLRDLLEREGYSVIEAQRRRAGARRDRSSRA